jgi:hypothetical protein
MLKICAICEKEFETKNATKTCSKECKRKLYAQTWQRCIDEGKERRRTGITASTVGRPRKNIKRDWKPNESDSLCWSCQKACGKCNWSRTLKPIEGWKVDVKIIKHTSRGKTTEDEVTKVVKCPEYKQDERRH